ncbi:MAG: hypothetical protein ABW049_07600 [Spongiibacteraceae bacterium]
MIWIPAFLTVLFLLGMGLVLNLRTGNKREQLLAILAMQLEHVLTLIQGVQKHRGLSGQTSAPALRQREQLALQLDRQWSDWSTLFNTETTRAAPRDKSSEPGAGTFITWKDLRATPTDFNRHCRLIDQLLVALELLERALLGLNQQRLNPQKSPSLQSTTTALTARCREIEDLGRVRGLSVRAARHPQCPIEMEVPLRYLCRRLAAGTLQASDPAIGMALREIQQKLLDTTRVTIDPERCFALLTPSMDRALANLRDTLPTARTPATKTRALSPHLPVPSGYGRIGSVS